MAEQPLAYHVLAIAANRNSCEQWPSSACLGHRPVVDGAAQPYKFITYAEAQEQTTLIASAFKALGLKRCDKICILGSNCPEWMLAMQVCSQCVTSATDSSTVLCGTAASVQRVHIAVASMQLGRAR
jgi:long-subunit acyl-CoA synthetase (AMP-forming)